MQVNILIVKGIAATVAVQNAFIPSIGNLLIFMSFFADTMLHIEDITIATDMEFSIQVLMSFNISDAGVLDRFRGLLFWF